jgi:cyclic pyranopterin phosphate synthase
MDVTRPHPPFKPPSGPLTRAPSPFLIAQAPKFAPLVDGEKRRVRYLRLSVTDRCNFRCVYCMPEVGLEFRPRPEILTFEEMTRLVRVFVSLGVTRVRLTGGEPLLRRDLPNLVAAIRAVEGVTDLALSTNGFFLGAMARELADAGLDRVNVSLDSLKPDRFFALARTAGLDRVLDGLDAALAAGLSPVKVNTVVIGGVNDDELPAMVRFAASRGVALRFIEHMPIGVDGFWTDQSFVPVLAMKARLQADYELVEDTAPRPLDAGPARHALLRPHDRSHAPVEVGFITAVSDHFCATCNRVRVTATGTLQQCLAFPGDLSLRDAIRSGAEDADLADTIAGALSLKAPGHQFAHGQYTLQSMSITGG